MITHDYTLITNLRKMIEVPFSNFRPTRFFSVPSASCFNITEEPGKSFRSRLVFGINQAKDASIGVTVSSMSLPYKQRPASNLRK